MPKRARRSRQEPASLVLKLSGDVLNETDRIARAGGATRNAYIERALRHYNRLHAVTHGNRVRSLQTRVVALFPPREAAPPAVRRVGEKPRR